MNERRIVEAPGAPAALGPYSHAVVGGQLVFASGQVALDPTTNEMVGGDDVAAQTRQVLDNLRAVLEASGTGLDRVMKATVYLIDLGDFAAMNEVYATYFDHDPPARACVEVSALPKGARVEIDAIALI